MNDARPTFDFGNGSRGLVGMGTAGFRLLCPMTTLTRSSRIDGSVPTPTLIMLVSRPAISAVATISESTSEGLLNGKYPCRWPMTVMPMSRVASPAMKRGKSVDFTGYWQRHIADRDSAG